MALCVAAACSSSDTGTLGTASPSPLSGAPPVTPSSSPGNGPLASPNEGPCATETNFLTLVCATDADCAPAGYCEPYPTVGAGTQLAAPELAAASGAAAGDSAPSCMAPADVIAASGPADLLPPAGAAPAADAGSAVDAGSWQPIGRCILYEAAPDPDQGAPDAAD